jgi:hypothetical protein
MGQKYPDVAAAIVKENDMSESTLATLTAGINEFKAQFKA